MDLQTMVDNAVKASRVAELKDSPQLLLGEIILKLEAIQDKTKPLFIDLMDKRPLGIDSWRGVYCELAIQTEDLGFVNTDEISHQFDNYTSYKTEEIGCETPTVEQWIEVMKKAVGRTFSGWKGGNFTMSKNTPVWLAEVGSSSFKIDDKEIDEENYTNYKNVYFIDVKEQDDKVYLVTQLED